MNERIRFAKTGASAVTITNCDAYHNVNNFRR